MVSRNDPGEVFFNSLNAVKGMLSPLELGIKKAAEDFECCWSGNANWNKHMDLILGKNGEVQIFPIGKLNEGSCHDAEVKKKGLLLRTPVEAFAEMVWPHEHNRSKLSKKVSDEKRNVQKEQSCTKCIDLAMTWSVLIAGIFQAFSTPFKVGKKRVQKLSNKNGKYPFLNSLEEASTSSSDKKKNVNRYVVVSGMDDNMKQKDSKHILCLIGLAIEQVTQNFQKFEDCVKVSGKHISGDTSKTHNDHIKIVSNIIKGRKSDVHGFLRNFNFARVRGVPSGIIEEDSVKDEHDDSTSAVKEEEMANTSSPKQATRMFDVPLSNVERLRSILSTVSLSELIELVPQLGKSSQDHPDKKKLFSVQDFFRYTESEGRRFFEELDRDGDGQVTMEDLESAMRKRKLPQRYARDLMRLTRSHMFCKSFGWKQFLSFMEQKEPTILRAYTSLCLSKSGTLQKNEVLASLKNAGLPANEDNAVAMMRFLNADTEEESISYGHFRNFMLLLPSDRLEDDPRNIWFEAATVVAVPPSVNIPAGNVLKSALAGGLASALSTSFLYPVDTIKTRVQASTLSFPEIIAKLPDIGRRGLYRGSIPAIIGQFSSHGLRTGICEATRLLLISVAPSLPEFQVQSVSSFCGTFLGTAVRIPCEVLKQRLQAGMYDNVGEAIVGTWNVDGMRGFFRGTGATLCREVPFYVVGIGLYSESKKVARRLLGRELEPWETILVGALSGGVASVATTPFDVMKTRMMTAPGGNRISMSMIAFSILRREGALGLFKGAIPRFFWTAPLGAMNFAGYELARKAMDKGTEEQQQQQVASR